MTEAEALEILKRDDSDMRKGYFCLNDFTALEVAKTALEKQIAKKPIYSDFDDNGHEEIIPYKAVCPTCGYEFEFGTWNNEQNHHCDCGQKLDWSEV